MGENLVSGNGVTYEFDKEIDVIIDNIFSRRCTLSNNTCFIGHLFSGPGVSDFWQIDKDSKSEKKLGWGGGCVKYFF